MPVAIGLAGSEDHSLHEPGYKAAPESPAISIASKFTQAEAPEPHCMMVVSGLLMRAVSSARKTSADLKRPFAVKFSLNQRFFAPGM